MNRILITTMAILISAPVFADKGSNHVSPAVNCAVTAYVGACICDSTDSSNQVETSNQSKAEALRVSALGAAKTECSVTPYASDCARTDKVN